ncbi:MAG: LysM domain-containing protein [Amphiplicatus sp.]
MFIQKPILAASAVAAAALAAGCASYERYGFVDPYTGAERLYERDHVHDMRPVAYVKVEDPAPAAYYGIEGARLAHLVYDEGEAERLDGVCPEHFRILRGETLADIAQYCDAPVATLIAYNPSLRYAGDIVEGQIVTLPRAYARLADVGIADAANVWHMLETGDTAEEIAARYNVRVEDVINLNPEIDWRAVPAGGFVRVPVSAPPAPASSVAGPRGRIDNGYRYPSGDGAGWSSGAAAAVASVMPYNLQPTRKPRGLQSDAPGLLTVDRKTVAPGGKVTVSAVGLPANREVTIYSGSNGRDLEAVKTARTDSSGAFSEPVRVGGWADLGGVIFKAEIDGGASLQSPRVGVDLIEPDPETLDALYDDE